MVASNNPRNRLPPLLGRYCPDRETIERQLRLLACKTLTFLTRFARACASGWSAVDGTGRLFLVCVIGLVLLAALLPSVAFWGIAITAVFVFASRARHWSELDRRDRLLVIGGNTAAVVALLVAIAGHSNYEGRPETGGKTAAERVAEPRMVEAYLVHQRFVLNSVLLRLPAVDPDHYFFQVPGTDITCTVTNVRFLPVDQTRIVRDGNYFRIRGRFTFDITRVSEKDLWVEYVCQMQLDPDLGVWRLSGTVEEIASNIPDKFLRR